MKFVKFSPSILSPDQMMAQSSTNESSLTTNAAIFPAIPVPVSALAIQRNKVKDAKTAQGNAAILFADTSKALAIENAKLGSMLLQDAGAVDLVAQATPANGPDIANKGGFASTHNAVHHTAVPDAPTGFAVTLGDHTGSADLHWDKMNFTEVYKVYYSLNTVTPVWVLADSTIKSSISLNGLSTGVPIAFKVEGHNVNGDGAPSAVVIKTLI